MSGLPRTTPHDPWMRVVHARGLLLVLQRMAILQGEPKRLVDAAAASLYLALEDDGDDGDA